MFADQIYQPVNGFRFGNVELDCRLSDVKVDLPRRAADIPKIGISHFSGAIHNAAHDRNLHSFKMLRPRLNPGCDGLQIEECPAAGWARDVICLERPAPSGLQDIERQPE